MTCSRSSPSKRRPRRNSVLRVALTGGIACGKSVVSRLLAEKGCALYSADAAAHDLMRPRRTAWKKVVAHFGPAGMLRGLAAATGFAILPPGGVAAGDAVRWLPLPG